MSLPTINDYLQAVQNPKTAFRDPILQDGKIALQSDGKPSVWSGGSAAIFKIMTTDGEKAIRCFTSDVNDRRERYYRLTSYLQGKPVAPLAKFKYHDYAIWVDKTWYPAVEMQWVNGDALDTYIAQCIQRGDTQSLERLAEEWKRVTEELRRMEVAHGNLDHNNALVLPSGEIRLIDYDCMFIPSLSGLKSVEIGHPNYQHPKRETSFFNFRLDLFSMLVIYLSIKTLAAFPNLWHTYHKDGQLIFNKEDFLQPGLSPLFGDLKSCDNPLVTGLTQELESYCNRPTDASPPLTGSITRTPVPPPLSPPPAPSLNNPVNKPVSVVVPNPAASQKVISSPSVSFVKMAATPPPVTPSPINLPPAVATFLSSAMTLLDAFLRDKVAQDKAVKLFSVFLVSTFLCGCPGLFLCRASADLVSGSNVFGFVFGGIGILFSLSFMLVPFVISFLTWRS